MTETAVRTASDFARAEYQPPTMDAIATSVGSARRPRVVIVGAGFGGLTAAKALRSVSADVTVVDRRNYHLFQPLLYQVATAGLSPADIASPIRGILRRQANAGVLMAASPASTARGARSSSRAAAGASPTTT